LLDDELDDDDELLRLEELEELESEELEELGFEELLDDDDWLEELLGWALSDEDELGSSKRSMSWRSWTVRSVTTGWTWAAAGRRARLGR
jgi:hypothetical protein